MLGPLSRRERWKGRIRRDNRGRSEEVLALLLRETVPAPVDLLVDVGCGTGAQTLRWAAAARAARCCGVDVNAAALRASTVPSCVGDLERGGLPLAGGAADVVVMHQVLEHLKNVHAAVAEANRVLRPGGVFAVGLPNLASAHNRLLLAAGRQPTFIQVRSPHVRGLTSREAVDFVESFGFRLVRSRGAGFYPAAGPAVRVLDRVAPAFAAFGCHVFVKDADVPAAAFAPFATADTNFSPAAPGVGRPAPAGR